MSDMFISNVYKNQLVSQAFGVTGFTAEDYLVDLFTNNFTVSDTTIASNLTPGAWTSYAQIPLPRSSLTAALTGNTSNLTSSLAPQFTNGTGSGVTVYGWMLRGATSGLLVCAQNLTGAPVTIPAGQTYTLYPFQIGLQSY